MPNTPGEIVFGTNIASLRKKYGYTQETLAERLGVSNKSVSKWERGSGYPGICQLVRLSEIFGVTVDSLLKSDRRGIAIAGNILTDIVKMTDNYPDKGMLANIISVSTAVGGCVPNTAIDLAKIDPTLSITAHARIGNDDGGKYILSELQRNGVDTSAIKISETMATSFSDVMTVKGTGERTFFCHRGTNAEFSPADIDIGSLNCRMLHIGYILLLNRFDEPDKEYGTVMARFLKCVQNAGIRTSFDVVSDSSGRFSEKVIPALRYTDNAFMNEIEGCGVSGLAPRSENGKPNIENIKKTMQIIMSYGVRERVIIHCPEAGFILNANGEFTVVPSVKHPEGFIKGTVGAGDAFCAGCLYGIYNNFPDRKILEFASGAATCNLMAADSVSGMRSKEYIYELLSRSERVVLE